MTPWSHQRLREDSLTPKARAICFGVKLSGIEAIRELQTRGTAAPTTAPLLCPHSRLAFLPTAETVTMTGTQRGIKFNRHVLEKRNHE
jgi:hypothetical protein